MNKALSIFAGMALLTSVAAFALLPSLPQPESYHQFADPWRCLGLPHCADFFSNTPLLLVGISGLASMQGRRATLRASPLGVAYRLFFIALIFTSLASAYYHAAPDNFRLALDRLAVSATLSCWLAILLGERFPDRMRLGWLPLLILPGQCVVLLWLVSELAGAGDLRPYLLFQALVFLAALVTLLTARRMPYRRFFFATAALYALALGCDLSDRAIADALEFASGHTLKHLLAGLAALMPLLQQKS